MCGMIEDDPVEFQHTRPVGRGVRYAQFCCKVAKEVLDAYHVEGHNILKRDVTVVESADQVFVHEFRAAACGKT